ncbi:MAG: putative lactoylglutathione lyase [Acidobacteriales bacterium]|nr:putative lactoylglutathione lyase [Terriglobales bacterium]
MSNSGSISLPPMAFGGVNPIFRVADLKKSLDYYINVLGFKVNWEYPYIASVSRGRCGIFLSEGDQGNPGAWVWIGVEDCETVFQELSAKGAKVRNPPSNYPWALEMQVEDLDGNVMRIGSDTKPNEPIGQWVDMYGTRWQSVKDGWKRVGK